MRENMALICIYTRDFIVRYKMILIFFWVEPKSRTVRTFGISNIIITFPLDMFLFHRKYMIFILYFLRDSYLSKVKYKQIGRYVRKFRNSKKNFTESDFFRVFLYRPLGDAIIAHNFGIGQYSSIGFLSVMFQDGSDG